MGDNSKQVFSTQEAVKYGWNTTLANWKPLLAIGGVAAVIAIIGDGLSRAGPRAGLANLFIQILQVAVAMVWIKAALSLHDHKPLPEWGKPAEWLTGFLTFLLVQVLYGLMVGIGMVLLIVPGVILAIMFGFAGFVAVDQKVDPIEAFKESRRLTEGLKMDLLVFGLALIGVNLLGAIALGIGLLITVPTSVLAAAQVFRKLQARSTITVRQPTQIMRPQAT